MPSRKKSKGQARKKAQAAFVLATGVPPSRAPTRFSRQFGCEVCFPPPPAPGNIRGQFVIAFHNALFEATEKFEMCVASLAALESTREQFPHAWANREGREAARQDLTAYANSVLVNVEEETTDIIAGGVVMALLTLEHYNPAEAISICDMDIPSRFDCKKWMKLMDAIEGDLRSLYKFFSGLNSCNCLDAKYAAARSQPYTGLCYYCNQRKKRSELFVCAGCNRYQWCSRACQARSWTGHQDFCNSQRLRNAGKALLCTEIASA